MSLLAGIGADRWFLRVALAVVAGLLLAFAKALEPAWWAAWLAPLPLLVAAFRAPAGEARVLAILAGAIGGASQYSYHVLFLGPIGAGLYLAAQALVWGAIVGATRSTILGPTAWSAPWVFAGLWSAFETLVAAIPEVGSAGSLAYSQAEFLPALQVAAFGGTPAVSFLVNLFPALAATAVHCGADMRQAYLAYGLPGALIAVALTFGELRTAGGPPAPTVRVGLAAMQRTVADRRKPTDERDPVWAAYGQAASSLANQGAKVVVLPEKIASVERSRVAPVQAMLGAISARHSIHLLVGVAVVDRDHRENRAWLFAPDATLAGDYAKHHLVPGFEAAFRPGRQILVIKAAATDLGLAICRDMDFPQFGRLYGRAGIAALLVPAYDFKSDAWQHARMAIVRGVEAGASVIRAADDGLLTVSDRFGRVIAARSSVSVSSAQLVADAPLGPGHPTVYARIGSAFGWLCVVAAAVGSVNAAARRLLRRRGAGG